MYKIIDLRNSVCNIPDDVTFHEKRKGGIFYNIFVLYNSIIPITAEIQWNKSATGRVHSFQQITKIMCKKFP